MKSSVCLGSDKYCPTGVNLRRSGNYKPTSWDYTSLPFSQATRDQQQKKCHEELRNYVKELMYKDSTLTARLNLVRMIHRLGVRYHFENDIKQVLRQISIEQAKRDFSNDVGSMAMLFVLLREHGFAVSQGKLIRDIFNHFIAMGNIHARTQNDVEGLLHLYEASYLVFENKETSSEERVFLSKCITDLIPCMDQNLKTQVEHALEVPLHWRVPRLETRWFIDHHTEDKNIDPFLLQFAKHDFNHLQVLHQQELGILSRWWRELGLMETLPFARDRLVESFFFATGIAPEPDLGDCREVLSKLGVLIVNLDDVYDIYGTFEELVLFTEAIKRWDIKATEEIPEYMKQLYAAILYTSKEIASRVLEKTGWDVLPLLRKSWCDACQSFLVEAKWYHNGHVPNLEEYLNNGWISSTAPLLLLHVFVVLGERNTAQVLQLDKMYPSLVRSCAMILRLCNDSATHKDELERGDAPSSISCYMHKHACTEQEAREAMKILAMDTWTRINEDYLGQGRHVLPPLFRDACVNLARMSVCLYQRGDGIGAPDRKNKDLVRSLFMDPIKTWS